ncbi:Panacea domain-containing protein [Pseudomonas tolaasii]|uniref:Panacea domain-containing protein n=1 Tax=Pseudomonas tolaasii TaxID=29442 RepID=UPI00352690B3
MSVTGLDYLVWPMGPVPVKLHNELENPDYDWLGNCEFHLVHARKKKKMLTANALIVFDYADFSKRKLKILIALAKEFRKSSADEMVECT